MQVSFMGGFGNWVSGWLGLRGGSSPHHYTGIVSPIPEPHTWLLLVVGLLFVVIAVRKANRRDLS